MNNTGNRAQFEKTIKSGIYIGIIKFTNGTDYKNLVYGLQKTQTILRCCGWNSLNDYYNHKYPSSCCNDNTYTLEDPFKTCLPMTSTFKGCKSAFHTITNDIVNAIFAKIAVQIIYICFYILALLEITYLNKTVLL